MQSNRDRRCTGRREGTAQAEWPVRQSQELPADKALETGVLTPQWETRIHNRTVYMLHFP